MERSREPLWAPDRRVHGSPTDGLRPQDRYSAKNAVFALEQTTFFEPAAPGSGRLL